MVGLFTRQLLKESRLFQVLLNQSNRQLTGEQNGISKIKDLIKLKTEVTNDHLTSEIALHLVTPNCDLWYQKGDDSPFKDPFWAFYWPGGQALTRFILDNKNLFEDKSVVDIGSGCGASAIACKMVGAKYVLANDIDTVALAAIDLNAELNDVNLDTSSSNLIGSYDSQWNIVLLGDMFYDSDFADNITLWMTKLAQKEITLYIGDPGRLSFINHPLKKELELCAEYQLPETCKMENNGLSTGCVWCYESK